MAALVFPPNDPSDLDDALESIANSALQVFSANACFVLAINPITKWLIEPLTKVVPLHGQTPQETEAIKYSDLAQQTLESESGIVETIITNDEGSQPATITTLISVAILTPDKKKPLAVLFLSFYRPCHLDEELHNLIRRFSEEAALMLKSTWLLRRYREVVKLGQEINQDLESPEILFKRLQDEVADILDTSHYFMLALHDNQTNMLDIYIADGGQYKTGKATLLSGGCAHVMQEKRPLIIKNFNEQRATIGVNFDYIPDMDEAAPQSLVYVPLLLRDGSIGALTVQQLLPDAYDEEDVQILELIGNQVSLAVASLRLFEYLQNVNFTAQELTRKLSSENILQDVVDLIRQNTKADLVILYPYQNKEFIMPIYTSGTYVGGYIAELERVEPDDMARLILNIGEPKFEEDSADLYQSIGGNQENRKGNFEAREKIRSTAALTMQLDDEIVGVLFVNFRQPQRFDAPQKSLILNLSHFAAIAIRNSRTLAAITQRRVGDLELLRKIDHEISKSLDLERVLTTILETANDVIKADNAAIALVDFYENKLKVEAAIGNGVEQLRGQKIPITRGRGAAQWVYENKIPVRVGNILDDPIWKDLYFPVSNNSISEIAVPLIYDDWVIGVLIFESNNAQAFSQEDEAFIVNLAGQAVIAIRNAQLYETQRRIAEELSAIKDIEHEIIGKLDFEEVLGIILEKALALTHSQAGVILLYDAQRDDLYVAEERGVIVERIKARIPRDSGIEWDVIESKSPRLVNANDVIWKTQSFSFIPDVFWSLTVPIIYGEIVRGVIGIESQKENPLTHEDTEVLTRLASLASITLQNAEQYREVKKQNDHLEILREIDREIIEQEDDPKQVIQIILDGARNLTNAEIAGLHLYEEDLSKKTYNEDGSVDQDEIKDGIVNQVVKTKMPYLTKEDAQNDPYYRGMSNIHSEVAVPLIYDQQVMGVLNLESERLYAFNEKDVAVLEMLANQAVIALQHSSRFREAKEQSVRFRVLAETSEELSKITKPEQTSHAYNIILQKMAEQSDGEILIRRFDVSSQSLALAGVINSRATPPRPSLKLEESLNGQVVRERRTIYLGDTDNLPKGYAQPIYDPGIKALVISPIIFEDQYYGNLVLSHEERNHFPSSDIQLLEGLAKQLAITLHRIDSLEAQRKAEEQAKHAEIFNEFGQSAYEVTHRLGNDLGLVKTYVNNIREFLEKENISSSVINEEMDKIVKDVGRVLGMSRGLKAKVATLGNNEQPSQGRETMAVTDVLENIKYALPAIPGTIDLQWEVHDDAGSVRVIIGKLIDILTTLVLNSCEALQDKERGQIWIRAYPSTPWFRIEVADNGHGIRPQNQDKIFNLFFSTKNSSGFGLWSARRYAQAMDGDLLLKESSPETGTTFVLQLKMLEV